MLHCLDCGLKTRFREAGTSHFRLSGYLILPLLLKKLREFLDRQIPAVECFLCVFRLLHCLRCQQKRRLRLADDILQAAAGNSPLNAHKDRLQQLAGQIHGQEQSVLRALHHNPVALFHPQLLQHLRALRDLLPQLRIGMRTLLVNDRVPLRYQNRIAVNRLRERTRLILYFIHHSHLTV